MKIYGVYETEYCPGRKCAYEGGTFEEKLLRLYLKRESAATHLDQWIRKNIGCEVADNGAICYYDECFCNGAYVNVSPIPEDQYLKNDELGYRECFIKELEVITD